ncbi:MAG: hypothetical protein SGPRY_007331 [Prymnesium sp.]
MPRGSPLKDAIPYSDALSRGKCEEFSQRCRQIGVKPTAIALPCATHEAYGAVAAAAGATDPTAPGHSPSLRMGDFRAGGFFDKGSAARRMPPRQSVQRRRHEPHPPKNTHTPAATQGFVQSRFGRRQSAATTPLAVITHPAAPPPCSFPLARPQSPYTRVVGGLLFPRPPPAARNDTSLATPSRHYARVRAQALATGEGDMALRSSLMTALWTWPRKMSEHGPFLEEVCAAQGTSPLRTASDAKDYPDKQSQLLAILLMHALAACLPRDPRRQFVKPCSALAHPLASIRIFGRWGIALPGYKSVAATMNGLMCLKIAYHGPHSMAPRRAKPMKFEMMRAIYYIPPSLITSGLDTDDNHDVFMFKRLNVYFMYTAFRPGEIVAHLGREVMFITRACLVWCICGAIIPD